MTDLDGSLDAWSFGAMLRRARISADWSLSDLADRVHYSKGYLSKIENGKVPPNTDLARRCDHVLGAGGALAAALPAHPPTAPVGPAGRPSERPRTYPAAGDMEPRRRGKDGAHQLTRRDALIAGAVSVLGMGAGLAALRAAAASDESDRFFLSTLADLRQQGWSRPPALLLPTLVAQTQAAAALAAVAPARRRADLFVAAARLAEFTGWMYQEADDLAEMCRWTDQARDYAADAGDANLPRFVLIRQANVALYRGDGEATVNLAREVVARFTPPKVLGLASLREAQGHALLGAADETERCLDRGQELLGSVPPGQRAQLLTLGISSPVDQVALVRGWCLYDLGRPDEAADVLGNELCAMTIPTLRTRARFGCRLALSLAADGRIKEACATTRIVLQDCRSVDSATIRSDLRRLSRTLARWSNTPTVRDLSGDLAVALSH